MLGHGHHPSPSPWRSVMGGGGEHTYIYIYITQVPLKGSLKLKTSYKSFLHEVLGLLEGSWDLIIITGLYIYI